jgi:hypothetical protein
VRLLKAKALALIAVGTAWYAVGGPRMVARRLAFAVIDAVIGKPVARSGPAPADPSWFNREPPARQR